MVSVWDTWAGRSSVAFAVDSPCACACAGVCVCTHATAAARRGAIVQTRGAAGCHTEVPPCGGGPGHASGPWGGGIWCPGGLRALLGHRCVWELEWGCPGGAATPSAGHGHLVSHGGCRQRGPHVTSVRGCVPGGWVPLSGLAPVCEWRGGGGDRGWGRWQRPAPIPSVFRGNCHGVSPSPNPHQRVPALTLWRRGPLPVHLGGPGPVVVNHHGNHPGAGHGCRVRVVAQWARASCCTTKLQCRSAALVQAPSSRTKGIA